METFQVFVVLWMSIVLNFIAMVITTKTIAELYKSQRDNDILRGITLPALWFSIGLFVSASSIMSLNLYRAQLLAKGISHLLEQLTHPDIMTKLYWIAFSLSVLFYYLGLSSFLTQSMRDTSSFYLIKTGLITLIIVMLLAFVTSVTGLFIPVNYIVLRYVMFVLAFIGNFPLLFRVNYLIRTRGSATQKCRLEMLRYFLYLTIIWEVVSTAIAIYAYLLPPNSVLFPFLVAFIAVTIAIHIIIGNYFLYSLLYLPRWIRRKYNIELERFKEIRQ